MGAIEMTLRSFETALRTKVEKAEAGSVAPAQRPRELRAVGYVRQGFGETDKKWTSPEDQKARIASLADAHDWHLVQTYEDIGWSGEDLSRPNLPALLSRSDFEILIVDRTERLTGKKKDLDFILALLEKRGITCVPATWSWEPLAQYMRRWYRLRADPVYARLDSSPAEAGASQAEGHASAGTAAKAAA
jgi:hypothetical protein